mgnify:CR=1 FL=1|tara:strand:- start:3695 stop:4618 length:924 start_codon:yes stop_codon:yes gene_type:complete
MAESTLTVDYMTLARELARQLGYGLTYDTGTVTSVSTTLTLTGGVWPTWIGTTTSGSGRACISIGGSFYGVDSRTNDTVIVLDAAPSASSLAYVIVQSNENEQTETMQVIQDCIDEGYRELCQPNYGNREMLVYVWSWLLESASITLASTDFSYDLPDDFDQYMTAMTWELGVENDPPEFVSQLEMRAKQAKDNDSGTPEYLTWRQKAYVASTGRRFEVHVHPTPSADVDVNTKKIDYLYRVLPNQLTPTNRYALCGGLHSDTLLKACQTAAERKLYDQPGPYAAVYAERLAASIQADLVVKQQMGI